LPAPEAAPQLPEEGPLPAAPSPSRCRHDADELLHLTQTVKAQSTALSWLRREHESLRDEARALRVCLEAAGVVTEERVLVTAQRLRFKRTARAHSFEPDATVLEALGCEGPVLGVAVAGGRTATHRLAMTSRRLELALSAVEHEVARRLAPEALYAVWTSSSAVYRGWSDGRTGYLQRGLSRYSAAAAAWEELTPPETWEAHDPDAFALEGKLYLHGGADFHHGREGPVLCFDPSDQSWCSLPPMNAPRHAAKMVAFCGRLYALGGRKGFHTASAAAECYDADRGVWEALPPLPMPRSHLVAVGLGTSLYTLGGHDNEQQTVAEAWRLVLGHDVWEEMPPVPAPHNLFDAVALGRMIYVLGSTLYEDDSTVQRLDPRRRLWEAVSRPAPRKSPVLVRRDGRLYIFGGQPLMNGILRGESEVARIAERFDPLTGRWEALTPAPFDVKAAVKLRSQLMALGEDGLLQFHSNTAMWERVPFEFSLGGQCVFQCAVPL